MLKQSGHLLWSGFAILTSLTVYQPLDACTDVNIVFQNF